MCLDFYLGYTELYLRVALENHRKNRIVCWFVTEAGKLCVAHSCTAHREHCKIGVLSVVYSHCGAGTVCSTDTVVCCIYGSLFNCMLSLHCYRSTLVLSGLRVCGWPLLCGCYVAATMH